MNCPRCNGELEHDGTQYNAIRGTARELETCVNPACEAFQSTFSTTTRPMTPDELDRYSELRLRLGIS